MSPNFADLLLLARLSNAAYERDLKTLSDDVASLGLTFLQRIETDRCSSFLATDNAGTVYLTFQGTRVTKNADPAEWLVDLEVYPIDLGGGRLVTGGAWAALDEVVPQILTTLAGLKVSRLRLTGHSLGGWLANLMHEVLTDKKIDHDAPVSFGAPKCGNAAYWKLLADPVRVTIERDFAPDHAPTPPWVYTTPQLWLHDGTWDIVEHRGWPNLSISDHSIDGSYIPALAKLANPTP